MEHENKKLTIGIFLICTGKYDIFLQPLIDSLDTHFFVGDDIVIYLFSDKPSYRLTLPARISVIFVPTPHRQWPFTTLYRYKNFCSIADKVNTDYVWYLDVDMLLVGDVGREILPGDGDGGITLTGHPGFWKGGGAWCNVPYSKAFVPEQNRTRYIAGGFQGGKTEAYMAMCQILSDNIDADYNIGFIAEWHDESAANWFASCHKYKCLTPEYCMIEEREPREEYQIAHMAPRILALKKNHDELRRDGNAPNS